MKKITINKWTIGTAIIIIILTIALAKPIYTIIDENENASSQALAIYNDLFAKDAQSKLQILSTLKSKHREPESTYVYKGFYNLFVTRVISSNNSTVDRIIKFQNGNSIVRNGEVFARLPSFDFKMIKKTGLTPPDLKGNSADPDVALDCQRNFADSKKLTGNVELKFQNLTSKVYDIEITDHAYKANNHKRSIKAGDKSVEILDLVNSHGWYDFSIKVIGNHTFEKRYAGRVETGKSSFSDPQMGNV